MIYQIITDRFYDGDTSNNVPDGFDATLYDGTEQYIVPADGSDVAGRIFMQTDSAFDTTTTAYQLIGELSDLRQDNDALAYGTTVIRYSSDDVLVYRQSLVQ